MTPYTLGQLDALNKLGMDAEMFAAAIQDEDAPTEAKAPDEADEEKLNKPPNWGNSASLQGGDVGTRQMQLGLPNAGPV